MTNQEIHRALGRIEGKTDAVLTQMTNITARLDAHDKRLSEVEKNQSSLGGSIKILHGIWLTLSAALVGILIRVFG